jgi:hypothetical protein
MVMLEGGRGHNVKSPSPGLAAKCQMKFAARLHRILFTLAMLSPVAVKAETIGPDSVPGGKLEPILKGE